MSTRATSPASVAKSDSPLDSAYLVARSDVAYRSVCDQSTAVLGSDISVGSWPWPSDSVKTTRLPTRAYSPRQATTVPSVRKSRKSGDWSAAADPGAATSDANSARSSHRRAPAHTAETLDRVTPLATTVSVIGAMGRVKQSS